LDFRFEIRNLKSAFRSFAFILLILSILLNSSLKDLEYDYEKRIVLFETRDEFASGRARFMFDCADERAEELEGRGRRGAEVH
jgi:hypothetical protein